MTHFLFRLTQITKKQGFCPFLAILERFSSVFGVFEGILTHFFVFFRLFGSFQAEFGPNPHPAAAAITVAFVRRGAQAKRGLVTQQFRDVENVDLGLAYGCGASGKPHLHPVRRIAVWRHENSGQMG